MGMNRNVEGGGGKKILWKRPRLSRGEKSMGREIVTKTKAWRVWKINKTRMAFDDWTIN
jgi:hypothetical protein